VGCCFRHGGVRRAERIYLLWKARQVADQQGSGAVAVEGGPKGEAKEALLDFAVHGLKGDLFLELLDYMGVAAGEARVEAVPAFAPAPPASCLPLQGRPGWRNACRIM
jgi:hypothetical protein